MFGGLTVSQAWYLRLDGIVGDSTAERREGEIEVASWSLGNPDVTVTASRPEGEPAAIVLEHFALDTGESNSPIVGWARLAGPTRRSRQPSTSPWGSWCDRATDR